jgi:hypothetical protein
MDQMVRRRAKFIDADGDVRRPVVVRVSPFSYRIASDIQSNAGMVSERITVSTGFTQPGGHPRRKELPPHIFPWRARDQSTTSAEITLPK